MLAGLCICQIVIRITDEMINTLAVAMDVVIEDGNTEERYRQLKNCLDTIERYEIER